MSADVNPGVERVIDLYDQYTVLTVREADSPVGADTFGPAREQMDETIRALLRDSTLREQFAGHVVIAQDFDRELEVQQPTAAERARLRAAAPTEVKMGWVALTFLDQPPENSAAQADHELPDILNQRVEAAAEAVRGQVLEYAGRRLIVQKTLAQTASVNEHWISTRPIFGDTPVDAYVASYRGNPMLFLRAKDKDSCIRIVAGTNDVSGDKADNAKQVCHYLGLEGETTYNLIEVDGGIELVLREQPDANEASPIQ